MKNTFFRIAILAVILAIGMAGCGKEVVATPTALPLPKTDTATETVQAMIASMNAGDLDGTMSYFADNARAYFYGLPPTGTEIYLGKEKIRPVFAENITGHFQWESAIDSENGGLVYAHAKTWHDFTRQIGVAPVEATEIFEVKDGKIQSYVWTISDTSLAKLKAALAEMPAEAAPTTSPEAAVSDLAITISNGTCSYEGSLSLNPGQVNVEARVLDTDKVLYALSFFTLDKDKDFLDLMAATVQSSPASWSNMFSIVDLGPGASKSYTFTAKDGPIYLICWSQPPDIPIGAVGPFQVKSEAVAATQEAVDLVVSLEELQSTWLTFCRPAGENCLWKFYEDGRYAGELVRIPGAVFDGKYTYQNGLITFESDSGLCSEWPQATYQIVNVARENQKITELHFSVVGEDACKDRLWSFGKIRPYHP
jgi:hypothetical protein